MTDFSRISLAPKEIVDFLKQDFQLREVHQKVLAQKVVAGAAQERGIVVSADEIQAEAERIRREQRLEKASDTLAWLADQMTTPDDWEAGICHRLLAQKLAKSLFDKDVEKYFAENQLEFDQIILYQITVPDEQLAQEIFYQIEEKEVSFYEAAHFYNLDEDRKLKCGYEGKLYRWSVEPDLAAALFAARPGEVIGPVQSESGYDLLMVEEFIPAKLDDKIRQEIINDNFEEWLESELNYALYSSDGARESEEGERKDEG